MARHQRTTRSLLLGATALAGALALSTGSAAAQQQEYSFDLPAQSLDVALRTYARTAEQQVIFAGRDVLGRKSAPVSGTYSAEEALQIMLAGSDLTVQRTAEGVLQVARAADPQGGSAAGGGAEVEALIVTAQKREEDIQDVPIAISAFTQEDLTRSQVAGGPDLMTQVPNMTFTKTNFSGYSIQIRGIGTQAISATTDPAVAVAFNNTPFIHNRFFEQEFYDLERVEVLRGPQGTLYGRNATAGVVNLISAKPRFVYEARAAADVANYNSMRLEGMANIPLIEDVLALRLAGAWTKRDGYVTNEIAGNPIDGRDLWSTRLSLRFEPTDAISANLIWEHFEENDDRLRSGKQLCKKDPTKTEIAGVPFPSTNVPGQNSTAEATYNQGCLPASLYSPESFQTPNGFSLPYYHPLSQLGLPTVQGLDPYVSTIQSRDLRVIESTVDPAYRAKADTVELQVSFDLNDRLTLTSETAYSVDELFSTQDYNRFNTAPGAFDQVRWDGNPPQRAGVLVDGVFCDPQIGCADRLVAVDLSTAESRHFSQEFRLASDYDGPFNFSLGANFLRFDTMNKYYVFINTLTLWAARARLSGSPTWAEPYEMGVADNYNSCLPFMEGDPNIPYGIRCVYIDPNPIGALNDLGHNYFLSKNPYRLISYAAFGEAYYDLADNLKLTAGLRWTVDKKHAPQVPSWLLAEDSIGYPVKEIIDAEWREPTGRLTLDWKPDLSLTDETLLYASYAHGYKAGGANPPPMVIVAEQVSGFDNVVDSVLHPTTFEAEFVDAFELGTKNTLLDGRLTLNANAFYYDYKGYQISQIIDRTAINSNFDAKIWGLELEADWRPMEALRFGLKFGYENTRVADGERAVDVMNRTAGNTDWVVAKPFPSLPSNCILPVSLVTFGDRINTLANPGSLGGDTGFCAWSYIGGVDPVTRLPYVENPTQAALGSNGAIINLATFQSGYWAGYPGFDPASAPNNGEGFFTDLSGNELPNAPHYTATLTADYTVPLGGDWLVNLHTDLYYQSEAWTRIFNMEGYDKLKAYSNINLAAIFTNDNAGWRVMAYVKNVLDRDSITGAFLNSDDSGLTTNVFLTEPRLYGLRVTKEWTGGMVFGGWPGERRARQGPYPITVEIGGGVNRLEPDTDAVSPDWLSIYALGADRFPLDPQDHETDWGDQRHARVTYASGDWRVSAEGRWGIAKGRAFAQDSGNLEACGLRTLIILPPFCGVSRLLWASSTVHDREEYAVGDLSVGREIGIGAWGSDGSSVISAGIAYADLKSQSRIEQFGDPDTDLFEGMNTLTAQRLYHDFETTIDSRRTFKGVGPTISWEASSPLLGGFETGRLNLDWSVKGAVLFGDQEVMIRDETREIITTGSVNSGLIRTRQPLAVGVLARETKSVNVPVASATLGLSYSIDWLEIGAGYRWERYFDAIDGGHTERKAFDRTIDGPYFKLSVGFGG